MIAKLIDRCIGVRYYKIDCRYSGKVAMLLSKYSVQTELNSNGGHIKFSLVSYEGKRFERILTENRVEYEMTEYGLFKFLSKYKYRPGIFIGMILFLMILSLSRNIVWEIDVSGNDTVLADEIISEMDSLGFKVGSYIPSIDIDKLQVDFLQSDRRFAWVAVNLFGTHATIEVRETMEKPFTLDNDTPHNLIAAEDGIIESVDIYSGTKQVNVGEAIKCGELLASGIVEVGDGFKLIHARGTVYANVGREIHIEVPLCKTEKIYGERRVCELTLKILGFSFKIFKSNGNLPINCDIIESERNVCFFGRFEVPIKVVETVEREYTFAENTLSVDEAKAEAYRKLKAECANIDGELVSRDVYSRLEGDNYIIDCKLRVIKDIAVEAEIYK